MRIQQRVRPRTHRAAPKVEAPLLPEQGEALPRGPAEPEEDVEVDLVHDEPQACAREQRAREQGCELAEVEAALPEDDRVGRERDGDRADVRGCELLEDGQVRGTGGAEGERAQAAAVREAAEREERVYERSVGDSECIRRGTHPPAGRRRRG